MKARSGARGDRRGPKRREDTDRGRRHGALPARRDVGAGASAGARPRATRALAARLRQPWRSARPRAVGRARSRCGRLGASERPPPRGTRPRAHRCRTVAEGARRPALEPRHPSPDGRLRSRGAAHRAAAPDRDANAGDVRGRGARRGGAGAGPADLGDRPKGARPRGHREARRSGSGRGDQPSHAPLCRVPAQVDAPHSGPC